MSELHEISEMGAIDCSLIEFDQSVSNGAGRVEGQR